MLILSPIHGGFVLDFLAQTIASIGVALNGFTPIHTPATECSIYNDIQYCYYQGSQDSPRAVYYMHGFGDNVEAWSVNYSTVRVDKEWEKTSASRPHIIVISKNVWWYVDKLQGDQLTEFVHWIEKKYIGFTPERVLYGESMGGHNAFRWALDYPQLFQKMSLLCPAIPRHFVQNPPPSEGFAPWVLLSEQLIRSYYAQSRWPDYNPLLVEESFWRSTPLPPEIHLMYSSSDEFGFFAGGDALYELLAAHPSLRVSSEIQSVNHCKMEASQLAAFLLK